MESYCENVIMPDVNFRIKSFISSGLEHVIEVHPHWHSEIEILYFINGSARQQINERSFIAESGDIVIIGMDQIHSTYSYAGNKCDILVIMFDVHSFFQSTLDEVAHPSMNIYNTSTLFKNPISSAEDSGKLLFGCVQEIHEELICKKAAFQHIIKSLIYKLTGLLVRYNFYDVCTSDERSVREIKNMLRKTFELIDKYHDEHISLSKAAANSNLSVPHFCRLFKKATGMTFNDYLVFYRVNRAEIMLGSDMTHTEIAMEWGFGSISSFIRSFKKCKKCTPSLHRKLQRKPLPFEYMS
jgi:AraC-like DNA-binding protein